MISVVIATYNYGHVIAETLASLRAQTLREWECVVVDDGSTDETARVVARFGDARVRYIRQENRGPAAARNRGIRETSGQYLQFLDADDLLAPDKLATQSAYLDAHPEVDIVIGAATFFRSEQPEVVLYSLHGHLSRPMAPKLSGTTAVREALEHFNIMVTPAPLVRRSVVENAGGFNEAMHGSEDWDLWLRCAIAGARFAYVEHPHAMARIRTHETSASRSTERMLRGLIEGARGWSGSRPLIYQVANAIDSVMNGSRLSGALQLFRASGRATVMLYSARWLVYGVAALALPRRLFWWFVTRPMPERGLELLRRLKGQRG